MERNFLFLNYCTEYSSKGTVNKRMKQDACFSGIFIYKKDLDNEYVLKLYKLGDFLNVKKQNNACLIDKKGIIHHLKALQSVFKFNYRLKEFDNYFELHLKLKAKIIYHKYLLTWVRYLYEFPFNVFLAEANKLKVFPEFRFESIINLFNLVGATANIDEHGCRIHAIGDTGHFKALMTTKEIQKKLEEAHEYNNKLNNIFTVLDNTLGGKYQFFDRIILEEKVNIEYKNDEQYSLEYWDSQDAFKTRKKLYITNYKILINKKKEK